MVLSKNRHFGGCAASCKSIKEGGQGGGGGGKGNKEEEEEGEDYRWRGGRAGD